jgi:hypothetical protein
LAAAFGAGGAALAAAFGAERAALAAAFGAAARAAPFEVVVVALSTGFGFPAASVTLPDGFAVMTTAVFVALAGSFFIGSLVMVLATISSS